MAFTVKALGAGSVTATGTIDGYVVPANKSALVTSVRMVNNYPIGAVPTMGLSVLAAGAANSRLIAKKTAVTDVSMFLVEGPFTLGAGDKIQLNLTGAGPTYDLQYSIFGVERD